MARRSKRWAALASALPGAQTEPAQHHSPNVQLAKLGSAPPAGDDWLHEIKWDGYRMVASLVAGEARLWTRNGLDWTRKATTIAHAIAALGVRDLVVDGELIAGQGRPADFGGVATGLKRNGNGLSFVLFDLLHVDGVSVAAAPLVDRKGLLEEILYERAPVLAYSSHVVGFGEEAFAHAAHGSFEGIISKRIDRPYFPGRGDDWRKTKVISTVEFAVVGFAPPEGKQAGFGSLLLAKPEAGSWRYAGRVGTGFSDELLRRLPNLLADGTATPSVDGVDDARRSLRYASWFPPRFVAEVFVRGYSSSGVLRQPSLKAIRPDKSITDMER